ncbi:4a-hydroxytetrahydrobiopterin dehydratase [Sinomonas sp. JGH33]|uniref:Putative pterin-4-alpha-carbinolamine dehydratase n=1 Tax=Sinomonas terricola TaxID=3110330 RepID=A0ABU5T1W1_9MICC|nr:4a-hydroxytetrahydrobiopterin dehydratase [Sinomonas sp. JGH33]MEA5453171.1 4a-hydroxytetrahydrobiopterin dehydratase [Sinomonas sp. JGH33]
MGELEVLDDARLAEELEMLPEWKHRLGGLVTVYKLPSAASALAFIAAVGEVSEELVHHPDLDWRYRRVFVRFSTHDAGGAVTAKDVEAAHRVSDHAAALDAVPEPERYPDSLSP